MDASVLHHRPGTRALPQPGAGAPRVVGIGPGRRQRLDREGDLQAARRHVLVERRLHRRHLAGSDEGRLELRHRDLDVAGQRLRDVRVEGRHEHPGRPLGQHERPAGSCRQGAIQPQRLAIQLDHDRVERMLDDTGVAPRCARAERRPLHQQHRPPRRREMRGRGRPDDASADDDHVVLHPDSMTPPSG